MPLCVVLIEIDIHAGRGIRRSLGRVALALVRNPLLIAIVLGIAVAASGSAVPTPVQRFLDLLAAAAGPCALFAIGLFLSDKPLSAGRGDVGFAVAGKLLLQPLLAVALVPVFLGFDSMWGKAAILLASLPSAANAFILARQYGRALVQCSAAIFLSTLVSVLTVSAVLVALGVGSP
jgi:malonate transporter